MPAQVGWRRKEEKQKSRKLLLARHKEGRERERGKEGPGKEEAREGGAWDVLSDTLVIFFQ